MFASKNACTGFQVPYHRSLSMRILVFEHFRFIGRPLIFWTPLPPWLSEISSPNFWAKGAYRCACISNS